MISVSSTSAPASKIDQRQRMSPRHVWIAHALQDAHRAAGIEGLTFEQMRATLVDQMLGDGIRVGIGRGHVGDAGPLDLVLRCLRQLAPHQRLGHVEGRRDQHQACELMTAARLREMPRQQERNPAAHGRADDDAGSLAHQLPHRDRLFEPIADGGVKQIAAGEPVAGIVEAHHGEALLRRPLRHGGRLGARHVGEKAREPKERRPLACPPAIGDAPAVSIGADLQQLRFECVHPKRLMTFRGNSWKRSPHSW